MENEVEEKENESSKEVIMEYLNSWPRKVLVKALYDMFEQEQLLTSEIDSLEKISLNEIESSDD